MHGLDVFEGGKGSVNFYRESEDTIRGFNGTEGFNEERNVFLGVFQLGEVALFDQIVTVSGSHTGPFCFVVILKAVFFCKSFVLEEDVLDAVAVGVLSLGSYGPGSVAADRDGVCEVVFVGRTRSELSVNSVVRVESTAAYCHKGCEGVTFRDDCEEAVGVEEAFCRSGIGSLYEFLIVVGNNAEVRHSHGFCVLTGDFMVSIVGTVHQTCDVDRLALEFFKADQRTGTVRHYGVTGKFIGACTEEREERNFLELVSGFVEGQTVCRKSYLETVIVEGVFESHTESRRSSIVTGVVGEVVVIVEFFVGVFGTERLDDGFKFAELAGLDFRVTYVNRHFKGDRELRLHFCYPTFGEVRVVRILRGVEGVELVVLPFIFDVGEDQFFETVHLDHTGNETDGLFFTEDVFNTDTVLDVLLDDLTAESSFSVAVHGLLNVIFKEGDGELGKELFLYRIGNRLVTGSNVPRVGECYLTGREVNNGDFTCEFFEPQLETVLFFDHDHVSELRFGGGVSVCKIIDDRFTVFIYLVCPGSIDTNSECTDEHNQSQECRYKSFTIHILFLLSLFTTGMRFLQ